MNGEQLTLGTERPCRCCNGTGIELRDNPIRSVTARPTDPDTSQKARQDSYDVRRFSIRSRQAKLLRVFSMGETTAQKAALNVLGPQEVSRIEGCRRRVSDLKAAGYLIDSGRRDINPGSNDEAIVWAVTAEGLRALERLEATGWSFG
jgi:hypothetical protein